MAGTIIAVCMIAILVCYILMLKRQIRRVNEQMYVRQREQSSRPVSIELLNRDLTELAANINRQFRAEEHLRLELLREDRNFKELIASISHDLRTPLTAIKGYVQLLERSELSEEQRNQLETVRNHAHILEQLTERLFEYTILLNTEQKPSEEQVNVTAFVADQLMGLVTAFEEKGIRVHFTREVPVYLQTDHEMLSRIIQNVLRNCIAYASGDVEIVLEQEEGTEILIRNPVKHPEQIDTGRLFDRFYTADSSRQKSTGLGLAIVKYLVEELGGTVYGAVRENIFELKISFPEE